jgi:hypothetical protein
MMELTGFALIAMVVIMVVMCGGMVFAIGWATLRGRKRRTTGQR